MPWGYYGRGRGFWGWGRGWGNPYPFCRFYPWLPRGWWRLGYSPYAYGWGGWWRPYGYGAYVPPYPPGWTW